jgi:phosphohistidine phosphatase
VVAAFLEASLRRLVLFRHGPAGKADPHRWPDDSLRPLTERGEVRTRRAARGLARVLDGRVSVWTSPYRRAKRTAELLAGALGKRAGSLRLVEALEPGRPVRALETLLAKVPQGATIVWVGHEPDFGAHAARFLGAEQTLPLKKAGACTLAFDGPIRAGEAELESWLPPSVLRDLGKKGRT